MEEVDDLHPNRGILRYVVLCMVLTVMAAALMGLATYAAGRAQTDEAARQKYFYYLSSTSLALLVLVIMALGWMLRRLIAAHSRVGRHAGKSGPPIDAWREAGRRYQVAGDEENRDEPPPLGDDDDDDDPPRR